MSTPRPTIYSDELIKFFLLHADNYQNVEVEKDYVLEKENFAIRYRQTFDVEGETEQTGTPLIVISYDKYETQALLSKDRIINTPAFNNPHFVFSLLLWTMAVHQHATDRKSELVADRVMFAEYLKHNKPLTEMVNGWFVLYQYNWNAINQERSQNLYDLFTPVSRTLNQIAINNLPKQ